MAVEVNCWIRLRSLHKNATLRKLSKWERRKSPGTESGPPYTNSAEEHCKSSLGAAPIPNRTQGHSSTQSGPFKRAMRTLLSWQCRRSTSPFACGWYDEVWWSLMPRILVVADQTSEVKCAPRSLASWDGMPKPATQCEIKAVAQEKVAASLIGAASGQRVTQSTVVRKNRCLCDGGKEPTRSMLTWSNRWVVSGYGS